MLLDRLAQAEVAGKIGPGMATKRWSVKETRMQSGDCVVASCILVLACGNHFTQVDRGALDRMLLGHG